MLSHLIDVWCKLVHPQQEKHFIVKESNYCAKGIEGIVQFIDDEQYYKITIEPLYDRYTLKKELNSLD